MRLSDPILLLTRPAPDNDRFLRALGKAGIRDVPVLQSPVLEIKALAVTPDVATTRTLIFTSANGVAAYHAKGPRPALPCHVVGERTAAAAQRAGHPVLGMSQNAQGLLAALKTAPPSDPVLHLRGTHARGDIAQTLAQQGLRASDVVIYDQVALPLSDQARAAAMGESPVVIPLFSPRSATQVAHDWSGPAPALCIALSDAVAQAARSVAWHTLVVVPEPTLEAMVAGVVELLQPEAG